MHQLDVTESRVGWTLPPESESRAIASVLNQPGNLVYCLGRMIRHVGFFHFVEGYDRPIEALGAALLQCPDAADALIVLPEGFNKGSFYYDQVGAPPKLPAHLTTRLLFEVAVRHRVTFVAGLLDPPLNSAVLVGPAGWCLLSHKKTDDKSGNCVPSLGCDPSNPLPVDDVVVGALLCNEVDRCNALLARLADCRSSRVVVCVPACMGAEYFSGEDLGAIGWMGMCVILANSRWDGCGSFIANTSRYKVVSFGHVSQPSERFNRIVLRSWPELEAPRTTLVVR